MKKVLKLFKSQHIHIALATGVCIVLLAYVSKRVLSEPMSNLILAIPPFIASVFEVLLNKYSKKRIMKTGYWVAAIFLSTALIILIRLV